MVFSLARSRPWKVASESITIDNLSNGRFVLPVGLGGTWDGGYARVSTDDPSRKVRAEKLDECLEILDLCWSGETVSFEGKHYWMKDLSFDRPTQRPRIPVWPVGAWPYPKSLARACALGRRDRLRPYGWRRSRAHCCSRGRSRQLDGGPPSLDGRL